MLTDRQKQRAYELLEEGHDTATVARRVRIPQTSVAALKAHLTMRNQPKVFRVEGSYLIQAPSREDAERYLSRKSNGVAPVEGDWSLTRVASSELS